MAVRTWISERKRRDGSIVFDCFVRATAPGGVEKTKRFVGGQTRREAEQAIAAFFRDDLNPFVVNALPQMTLDQYAPQWLERRRGTIADGTYDAYAASLATHILPILGDVPLNEIKPADIDDFRMRLGQLRPARGSRNATLAPKTISNALSLLHGILACAVDDRLLARNPARRESRQRTRPRERYSEIEYLRRHEVGPYLEAWDDEGVDLRLCAELLLFGGLRVEEALAVRESDIRPAEALITVMRQGRGSGDEVDRRKTGNPCRVEIPTSLARRLAKLGERRAVETGAPDPELFVIDGRRPNRGQIRDRHLVAARRAGVRRHIRLHALRHTAAYLWLQVGRQPLAYVQAQLGHRDMKSTAVYAHWEIRESSGTPDLIADAIMRATDPGDDDSTGRGHLRFA